MYSACWVVYGLQLCKIIEGGNPVRGPMCISPDLRQVWPPNEQTGQSVLWRYQEAGLFSGPKYIHKAREGQWKTHDSRTTLFSEAKLKTNTLKSFQVPATAGDGLKSPLMGMLEKCRSPDFRNKRILDSQFFLLSKIQPVKIDVKAAFHQFRSVHHGLGGLSSLNYTNEQNCQSRRGLKVRWSLQDDKPATHQDIDPRWNLACSRTSVHEDSHWSTAEVQFVRRHTMAQVYQKFCPYQIICEVAWTMKKLVHRVHASAPLLLL
jgi:hypothetical protein